MNFAIVEDESIFMEDLKTTLYRWKPQDFDLNVHCFTCAKNILEAYRVKQTEYDIIFMDVRLGDMDGITTARSLRQLGFQNAIVFTTNHTEVKLIQEGYDVGALYYFCKPITAENISKCIDRIVPDAKYSYVHNKKQVVILYNNIVYFEGARNYVNLHTLNPADGVNSRHRLKISDLIWQLPPIFIQCHRSYVVNMSHIILLRKNKMFMRNRMETPLTVGDAYLDNVLTAFKNL